MIIRGDEFVTRASKATAESRLELKLNVPYDKYQLAAPREVTMLMGAKEVGKTTLALASAFDCLDRHLELHVVYVCWQLDKLFPIFDAMKKRGQVSPESESFRRMFLCEPEDYGWLGLADRALETTEKLPKATGCVLILDEVLGELPALKLTKWFEVARDWAVKRRAAVVLVQRGASLRPPGLSNLAAVSDAIATLEFLEGGCRRLEVISSTRPDYYVEV